MEQHAEANEIPSVDKLTDFLQKISNFRALAIQYETEKEHEQEYNEESQNELASHKLFNKSNPTNSLVMSCATKQSEKKIPWRNILYRHMPRYNDSLARTPKSNTTTRSTVPTLINVNGTPISIRVLLNSKSKALITITSSQIDYPMKGMTTLKIFRR
ncbi:hypothetical protein HZH68_014204 [Vespula germanica]|uniref:Uncharacterized protein n=1 Tax=Vespula germanica TaxID=30212 RepID=A0A834JAU5_VESGE|nr:hypothetical protein HZH68_014204 [Vespula germanica]